MIVHLDKDITPVDDKGRGGGVIITSPPHSITDADIEDAIAELLQYQTKHLPRKTGYNKRIELARNAGKRV